MKQMHYNKVRRTAFFASVVALMALSQEVKAQWFLNGNNLGAATSMGSNTAQNVIFETNNVPRMTLLGVAGPNQGFFGIGVPNPQTHLEVLTDSRVRSTIAGSQLTFSANSRQFIDASTELRVSSTGNIYHTIGNGLPTGGAFFVSSSTPGNILTTVLSNGFMGVGTINPSAKFQVFGGQISQVQAGTFGLFAAPNEWIGLGVAGSASFPITSVYGLGMARGGFAGYYNLVDNGAVKDMVIGFGNEGAALGTQRMRIRSILTNGASAPVNRDIMVINPNGYVGIGNDPGNVALAVDATPAVLPAVPGLVRGISVLTAGSFASPATATFASIGEQFSSSCPNPAIVGMRAQNGTAGINCQVSNNVAEMVWQDLTYTGNVGSTTGAEARMTFNFRNANPGPCLAGNSREVMTILANGRVGINTPVPIPFAVTNVPPVGGLAIDFYLDVNGGVRAEGYWAFSDQRFKSNVQTLQNPMERIMKIRGTSYTFRGPSAQEGAVGVPQIGFIAQELEQVVPEAVVKGSDGVYAVNYNSLTPLLVEGIKQQQTTIQTLTDRVAELEKQLAQQNPGSTAPTGTFQDQLPVNPALGNLQQNVPNPFNQQTVINFNVAQNAGVAMIAIYDLNGRQIRSEQVNQRGAGQLVINANELSPGMYIYALIVDGKAADSKRMIVTE
jgi:Chaperone of endosialidase/Secretion system C-terminal sorting domain